MAKKKKKKSYDQYDSRPKVGYGPSAATKPSLDFQHSATQWHQTLAPMVANSKKVRSCLRSEAEDTSVR